jgi:hypothetical protein
LRTDKEETMESPWKEEIAKAYIAGLLGEPIPNDFEKAYEEGCRDRENTIHRQSPKQERR